MNIFLLFLLNSKLLYLIFNIIGGQKNYGSKSGNNETSGKSKTAKKQTPVYNEKAMLLSSDEEIP